MAPEQSPDSPLRCGAWTSTILLVVSDHGMDGSLPHRFVDIPAALRSAGFGPAHFQVIHNGEADLVDVPDAAKVSAMARVISGLEGVGAVVTDSSTPSRSRAGPPERGTDRRVRKTGLSDGGTLGTAWQIPMSRNRPMRPPAT